MKTRSLRRERSAGATLIELAVVIALVGILGALMVNFAQPVRGYIDTSRRAALADTADLALRRIGRDVRMALPNSVRVMTAGSVTYLEFVLVRTGGRYRFEPDSAATNTCASDYTADPLSFTGADTCFKTIGNILNVADITTNDYVVVFNLPPEIAGPPLEPRTPNADVYEFAGTGGNKSRITVPLPVAFAGEDRITIESHAFTYESPGQRFYIVEGPVTYACDTSTGELRRYSGYGFNPTQLAPGGAGALLASGVVAPCTFTYDASIAAQGTGLVTLALKLRMQSTGGGTEDVSLYHAVHVNNVP